MLRFVERVAGVDHWTLNLAIVAEDDRPRMIELCQRLVAGGTGSFGGSRWMTNKTLSVLLVEDDSDHVELIRHAVKNHGGIDLEVLSRLEDCRTALATKVPDLLILNLNLPDGQAIELLTEGETHCPMLIMTSQGSEALAVEALKAGALDYIVKSGTTFADMSRTIERVLSEWMTQQERRQARLELVFDKFSQVGAST